jgi:hypothetical protein
MSGFEEYQRKEKKNDQIFGTGATFAEKQNTSVMKGMPDALLKDSEKKVSKLEKSDEDESYFDAEQLREYLEKRFSDESGFAERTKYYFQEYEKTYNKQLEYKQLSESSNDTLDLYYNRYRNNYADKRKASAGEASKYYGQMASRIAMYQKDDEKNLSNLEKYERKEKIMELRLNGMLKAAEVRSKSEEHEDYLKGRAKLSCAMVLKDQLEHYLTREDDQKYYKSFEKKLADINKQISDVYMEVQKSAPKTQDLWRMEKGIDEQAIAARKTRAKMDGATIDTESANLLLNLEKIKADAGDSQWPVQIVLRDNQGACINKAEAQTKEWNEKLDSGITKEIQNEAIERFNKLKAPTEAEIEGDGASRYIMSDVREYYDLFHRALPYYLDSTDATVTEYKEQYPEFVEKLSNLSRIKDHIDESLKNDNHIIVTGSGQFEVQRDNDRA